MAEREMPKGTLGCVQRTAQSLGVPASTAALDDFFYDVFETCGISNSAIVSLIGDCPLGRYALEMIGDIGACFDEVARLDNPSRAPTGLSDECAASFTKANVEEDESDMWRVYAMDCADQVGVSLGDLGVEDRGKVKAP